MLKMQDPAAPRERFPRIRTVATKMCVYCGYAQFDLCFKAIMPVPSVASRVPGLVTVISISNVPVL
eukprot:6212773-Pleurochrysis_carterae.AAC.7